ncbi:MAG: hypothetical protein ABI446_06435 [Gemmatimonadaceae bacterium]
MKLTWMAVGAMMIVPCAAMAQSKTKDSTASKPAQAATTTSAGEVSGPGADVTPAMLAAQKNPNEIGTPAWWANHSTADGKPLSAQRTSYK